MNDGDDDSGDDAEMECGCDDGEDGDEGVKGEDDAHGYAADCGFAGGGVEGGEGGDGKAGVAVAGGGAGVVFLLRGVVVWRGIGLGGALAGEEYEHCDA